MLPVVPSDHETAVGDEPSAGTQGTETSPGATPSPETERRGAPPSSSPQRGTAPPTRAPLEAPPAEDVAEAIRGCSKTETTLVRQMETDEPFFLPESPCRGGKTGGRPAGRQGTGAGPAPVFSVGSFLPWPQALGLLSLRPGWGSACEGHFISCFFLILSLNPSDVSSALYPPPGGSRRGPCSKPWSWVGECWWEMREVVPDRWVAGSEAFLHVSTAWDLKAQPGL